ncbi:Uncharacterized protein OBRU01_05730 [Operophtera brumata]|uniref:F-box/LRR-repeat protein 2 n=1 Tax=Operophtera brumata TaxID=104452 RepID=A0A0L7L5Z3_OPEBR|nr:Uncharacterized protein OBRU01_05730 [Operophtera brumata]
MDIPTDVWGQLALEASQVYLTEGGQVRSPFANTVLLNVMRWRLVAYDTRLWTHVSLRPEISGLHVGSLESLLALISIRFGPSLRYIELPIELITHTGFMRKIYNFINGLEILHLIGTYEKVEEEEEEIYEVINVHKLKSATPNLRVINLYGINFVDDSHIDAFSSNCIQLECLAVNYCNKVTGSTMKTLFQRSRRLTCLLMSGCNLLSEHVMQVEWEKSSIQELDVTATDLSAECLIDMLTRIPNLRFLSAGQINGFNDSVLKAWMEAGTARNLVALDLDSSDNITDEALHRFLSRHGSQLWGLVMSGMPHITDQLWQSVLQLLTNAKLCTGSCRGTADSCGRACCSCSLTPSEYNITDEALHRFLSRHGRQLWQSVLQLLTNAKILIMGTHERLGVNIHVDQLMDGIANSCPNLERLELRWDPENLRFSDKKCQWSYNKRQKKHPQYNKPLNLNVTQNIVHHKKEFKP